MENVIGKTCLHCGGKLVPRCGVCHKSRNTCRNEYCTGQSELACKACGRAYIDGNLPVFQRSGENQAQSTIHQEAHEKQK